MSPSGTCIHRNKIINGLKKDARWLGPLATQPAVGARPQAVITPRRSPAHLSVSPSHGRLRSTLCQVAESSQAHTPVGPAPTRVCGPRARRDVGRGRGAEGILRAAADPAGRPWGRASSRRRAGPAHLGRFLRQQELAQEICLENQVCTGQGPLRAGRLVYGWMEAVSAGGQMSTRGWVGTVE